MTMEKLERNPLFVLDGVRRLAELIECDVPRLDTESRPLAMALLDVQWLHQKAIWFPEQARIQEQLRYLANHLGALARRAGERGRVEMLRRCHDEITQLRSSRGFGSFASAAFCNEL